MNRVRRLVFLISLYACAAQPQERESQQVMEGLPEHLIYLYTRGAGAARLESAREQLYADARRWERGRVLRVCLFGGNPTVATLIRTVAGEWNGISSVTFDFGPMPAGYNCLSPGSGFYQVRIGFSERGYWSVLGMDSERLLDPLVPSMNLEGFNRMYSEARYSPAAVVSAAEPYHLAVLRHEFGHALALLHEHQNPKLKCTDEIKWSGQGNVYDYFAGPPNHWSAVQVERNLGFIGQTDPDYVAGEPDPKSVMMYTLPANIFKAGFGQQCAVPVNYEISTKDKAVVAKMYPPLGGAIEVDEGAKISNLRPLPSFIPGEARSDLMSRVLVDLESNDAYVRRDARARLADLLDNGASSAELSNLIDRMARGSYRYQLGVATALANSPAGQRLNPDDRKQLSQLQKETKDATLSKSLQAIK